MSDIELIKVNEVYLRVDAEPHILAELGDHFTFLVPGHQFMPAFRNRLWDGKIRLLDTRNQTIYSGLIHHIEQFAQDRDYDISYPSDLNIATSFSLVEGREFASTLNLPFEPRDYQMEAFVTCVRDHRKLILCPTGSGKSLIAYLLTRYYQQECDGKILIIVPTISLVNQLYKDFADYGWNTAENVHRIMQGKDKATDLPVVISTWQSAYKLPKAWFDQFDVVIGDEAHLFQAKSIQTMMTKMTDVKYRFGMTGTLADAKTHSLVLEGLFGRIRKIIKTKDLQKAGHLAKLQIKAVALKYAKDECRVVSKMKYHEEIDFLVSHKKRNIFIRNLALSLSGNTLVLFNFVEKHGNVLHRMIEEKANDKQVYYVWGGTDAELREQVREITENNNDVIIVASAGVFSTGVNIKNLHNVIFSHPGKSKIRVLQSIGRVLRTTETKESATLYDIVDDLTNGSKKNFAATHFIERHKYYVAEKFPVKLYKVEVK
jgi:superfamily II DNA or RNA helicase